MRLLKLRKLVFMRLWHRHMCMFVTQQQHEDILALKQTVKIRPLIIKQTLIIIRVNRRTHQAFRCVKKIKNWSFKTKHLTEKIMSIIWHQKISSKNIHNVKLITLIILYYLQEPSSPWSGKMWPYKRTQRRDSLSLQLYTSPETSCSPIKTSQ